MSKSKQHISIKEQIEILINRGLRIDSKDEAEHFLSIVSYHSLTSYRFPFTSKENDEMYNKGTKFTDLVNLYYTDLNYKTYLYQILQHIEVAFKTQLIYRLSKINSQFYIKDIKQQEDHVLHALKDFCEKYSVEYSDRYKKLESLRKTDKSLFEQLNKLIKKHNDISQKVKKLEKCMKSSNNVYIKHFIRKNKPNKYPEAWIALEAFDFGQLIDTYEYSQLREEKQEIAKFFNISNDKILIRCLREIKRVRNIISHHDKILDRMEYQPTEVIKFLVDKYTKKNMDRLIKQNKKTFLPYFLLIKYFIEQILSNTNEYMYRTYCDFLNMSKDNKQYLHLVGLENEYFNFG